MDKILEWIWFTMIRIHESKTPTTLRDVRKARYSQASKTTALGQQIPYSMRSKIRNIW